MKCRILFSGKKCFQMLSAICFYPACKVLMYRSEKKETLLKYLSKATDTKYFHFDV